MDEQYGFIHERIEIKLLILYILRQLPSEIDPEALSELVLIDGGIGYFDYKDCLAELIRSAQVEETEDGCRVTAKGAQNCEVLESSLPYSVRAKARRAMHPVIEEMRRRALILANHEPGPDGGVLVYLSMSDGVGSVFDLKLLAADEAQAKRMERNFKRGAEAYYQRFVAALSE